jgi:hypothetical protein
VVTEQTSTPEPDAPTGPGAGTPPTSPGVADDHGEALERSAEAIREARDAEAPVADRDDITVRDDERAGVYSEDVGGEGGHP